jgi:hypothetical protein
VLSMPAQRGSYLTNVYTRNIGFHNVVAFFITVFYVVFGSSVAIVTGLRSERSTLHRVQSAVLSSQPAGRWVPGAISRGRKRSLCEVYHSPRFSAELRNACDTHPLPRTSSWLGV